MTRTYTIAYRNPRANSFKRVTNWSGTWREAVTMCGLFGDQNPDLEVWYLATRETELSGYVHAEDIGNILLDSGKRARIFETGKISEELVNTVFAEPVELISSVDNGKTYKIVGACAVHRFCALVEEKHYGIILTEHMTREELERFTARPELDRMEAFNNWVVRRVAVNPRTEEDAAMAFSRSGICRTRNEAYKTLQRMLRSELRTWSDMGMKSKRDELLFIDTLDYSERNRWERDGVRWSIIGSR